MRYNGTFQIAPILVPYDESFKFYGVFRKITIFRQAQNHISGYGEFQSLSHKVLGFETQPRSESGSTKNHVVVLF